MEIVIYTFLSKNTFNNSKILQTSFNACNLFYLIHPYHLYFYAFLPFYFLNKIPPPLNLFIKMKPHNNK
jgi:hypothetical protein